MNFTVAMGIRPGDFLEFSNQWAKIRVTYDKDYDPEFPYQLSGDILNGAHYKTLASALDRAMEELGAFQIGACR